VEIKQANTYTYEMKHFGELLKLGSGVPGECFKNCKHFAEQYRKLGRDVSISLVLGMRSFESSDVAMCYHYLLKDNETQEYIDPQYWRYTFIELHNWSVEEYIKDCCNFEDEHGIHPAEEFFMWYVENGYNKVLENSMRCIKALSNIRVRLSDNKIKEYLSATGCGFKPTYGKQVINKLSIY
jgi:hypothetical protein